MRVRLYCKVTFDSLRDVKNGITIMYHDFRGYMFQVSVTIPREIPHQTESSFQVTSYMRALSLVCFLPHKYTEVVSLLVSLVLSTSIYVIFRWDCIKYGAITIMVGVHINAYLYLYLGCSEFR